MKSALKFPLNYPFDIVRNSFAIIDRQVCHARPSSVIENDRLDASGIFEWFWKEVNARVQFSNPIGILTCGSNASPTRLAEKLQTSSHGDTLALRLSLRHWIPVYAATLSYYGSVPATFARIEGANAEPFLLIMDYSNLKGMIESEQKTGNYDLYSVDHHSIGVSSDFPIFAFVAKNGALKLNEKFVFVREFQPEAIAVTLPAQRDIVARLLTLTGRSADLSDYNSRIENKVFLTRFREDIRSNFKFESDISDWRLLDVHAGFDPSILSR